MGKIIALILAFCQNAVKGKADKVSGGTTDNVLVVDANGNPSDSGHSINDVITSGIFTGELVDGELRITLTND